MTEDATTFAFVANPPACAAPMMMNAKVFPRRGLLFVKKPLSMLGGDFTVFPDDSVLGAVVIVTTRNISSCLDFSFSKFCAAKMMMAARNNPMIIR